MGVHPWERQEGESDLWFRRFDRYRLLFPVRSVTAVFQEEQAITEEKRGKERKSEPSGRWYEMAKLWRWQERAEAWDAHLTAEEEEARKRVLGSGLALVHRRVLLLNETLNGLLDMLKDDNKVWLPDVKAIGTGEFAERVDLVQFNDALYKEIREYITDIAEEVGGRVKKNEAVLSGSVSGQIGYYPVQLPQKQERHDDSDS